MELLDRLKKPKEIPKVLKFKGRTPTEEQRAIIEEAVEEPQILVIGAGAGTGKTTQLEMLAQVLRGNGQ